MSVLLSGFADEAAKGLREQIAIHKQFGIHSLEIRNVDGVNIGQMTDAHLKRCIVFFRKKRSLSVGSALPLPIGRDQLPQIFRKIWMSSSV